MKNSAFWAKLKSNKKGILLFLSGVLLAALLFGAFEKRPYPFQPTFSDSNYYAMEEYESAEFEAKLMGESIAEMAMSVDSVSRDFSANADDALGDSTDGAMIIRSGNLSLHVDDVQKRLDEVSAAAENLKGRVVNQNLWRGNASYNASLTLRVPVENFFTLVEEMKALSLYTISENVSADDVTEQVLDLELRIRNLEAEEAQFLSILDRAGEISEVLEVTRELTRVRTSIERLEAQLLNLSNRVDESTLYVELYEDASVASVAEKWRPLSVLNDAFKDFVVFLQGVVDGAIYLLVFGMPALLVLGIVWLFYKKAKKK